jgi:hypothetical protein
MRLHRLFAVVFVAVVISGCAHSLNVLDRVRPGQSESEAVAAVGGTPKRIVDGGKMTRKKGSGVNGTYLTFLGCPCTRIASCASARGSTNRG